MFRQKPKEGQDDLDKVIQAVQRDPTEFVMFVTAPVQLAIEEYTEALNASLELLLSRTRVWTSLWSNKAHRGSAEITSLHASYERRADTYGLILHVYLEDGLLYARVDVDSAKDAEVYDGNRRTDLTVQTEDVRHAVYDLCGPQGSPYEALKLAKSEDEATQLRQYTQRRMQQYASLRWILQSLAWQVPDGERTVDALTLEDGYIVARALGFVCVLMPPDGRTPELKQLERKDFLDELDTFQQGIDRLDPREIHEYAEHSLDMLAMERHVKGAVGATLFFGDEMHVLAGCFCIFRGSNLVVELAANTMNATGREKDLKTKLGQVTSVTPMQVLIAIVMYWAIHSTAGIRTVSLTNFGGVRGVVAYSGAAHANGLKIYTHKGRIHPLAKKNYSSVVFAVSADQEAEEDEEEEDENENE
jgi:hypothetical protein